MSTIDIPVSEGTYKKLRALAALSGKDVGSIQEELTQIFEEYISTKIKITLDEIDGVEDELQGAYHPPHNVKRVRVNREVEAGGPVTTDDISGHSLSEDADEGAPSLEELVAETPPTKQASAKRQLPQVPQNDDYRIPDLDIPETEDAEDFIDGIEANPAPSRSPLRAESVARKPQPKHQPGKPRVKISEAGYHEEVDRDLF